MTKGNTVSKAEVLQTAEISQTGEAAVKSPAKAKVATKRRKASYHSKRQALAGYAFMTPWIIGFLILTAWPFFYTIYLSFFAVNYTVLGWNTDFVGIANYDVALLRNPYFVPNLISFVIMQVTYAPAITVIAFILALLLNREIKMRGLFRALFFFPVIVMSGPVMNQLMDSGTMTSVAISDMVLLNMVAQFSVPVANALIFLFENYSVVLWFTGIPIILFISGLQKIDGGILEAARIDSATAWQILWKITLPILRPIILVSFILTVVQLASFTMNPVLPMIQDAIQATTSGLGLASAFAWVYSLIVLLIIGVAYLFLKEPKYIVPPEIKMYKKPGV
ncbi:MAG: sugar ABC transporter permease [Defluviitaleaceae bacterium]|nr:sugar ABC transporter permease [Defluviitaleaceae bacterium]